MKFSSTKNQENKGNIDEILLAKVRTYFQRSKVLHGNKKYKI